MNNNRTSQDHQVPIVIDDTVECLRFFPSKDINCLASGGWDGKYKGRDMPQGVYFVLVNAKGADGRTFTIKRDVNLIRDYNQTSSSTTPSE